MIQQIPEDARALLKHHYGRLRKYLAVRGCTPELLEKNAADAILIVVHSWGQYQSDGQSPLESLYTVATTLCREQNSNCCRILVLEGEIHAEPDSKSTSFGDAGDSTVGNSEVKAAVWLALAKTELPLRVVLWLRQVEKFDVKQTADILQIPEGTVRAREYHGERMFKGLLRATRTPQARERA
ncbi:RNA polymerase sigma factor [Streptomyces resistomycificus]|uniref:RNA polymerase sigma factor n=1 Tax=Streptomyces resistomycificus TaxID=67356 RepID=UPI000FE23404|nr:sigma-70 family RNA polymerase sigma factor [Streptomyces resistomycificus]